MNKTQPNKAKPAIYKTSPATAPKRPPRGMIQEKSCGIVLFRIVEKERWYLLLHYPGGHWDFGKGHVEKIDKDELATARREMEEETGTTKITFIKDFRYVVDYYYRRERKLYHKDVIFFIGKTTEEKVKLSHEHQGFAWLKYDDAMKQLTFENARKLLKKSEMFLRNLDQ